MQRGLLSRRQPTQQELAQVVGEKFKPWKTGLQQEFMLDRMQALSSERHRYVKQFVEAKCLEDLSEQERKAWRTWLVMYEAEGLEEGANTQIVKSFIAWLLGRGDDKFHRKTPWGRETHAMELPEARAFVDGFVDALMETEKYLLKLIWKTPQTLEEYWIYFKYVLNADTYLRKDDPWFFVEFKALTGLPMGEDVPAWEGEKKLEEVVGGVQAAKLDEKEPHPQLAWTGPQFLQTGTSRFEEWDNDTWIGRLAFGEGWGSRERARVLTDLYRAAYGSKEFPEVDVPISMKRLEKEYNEYLAVYPGELANIFEQDQPTFEEHLQQKLATERAKRAAERAEEELTKEEAEAEEKAARKREKAEAKKAQEARDAMIAAAETLKELKSLMEAEKPDTTEEMAKTLKDSNKELVKAFTKEMEKIVAAIPSVEAVQRTQQQVETEKQETEKNMSLFKAMMKAMEDFQTQTIGAHEAKPEAEEVEEAKEVEETEDEAGYANEPVGLEGFEQYTETPPPKTSPPASAPPSDDEGFRTPVEEFEPDQESNESEKQPEETEKLEELRQRIDARIAERAQTKIEEAETETTAETMAQSYPDLEKEKKETNERLEQLEWDLRTIVELMKKTEENEAMTEEERAAKLRRQEAIRKRTLGNIAIAKVKQKKLNT